MKITIERVLNAYAQKGYVFSNQSNFLNLFGVRAKERRAGKFDDVIGAFVFEEDKTNLYIWEATVDPSPRYLKSPINSSGTAILVPGQYLSVWKVDVHNGWCRTLCQRNGSVRVFRDSNRDQSLDMSYSKVMEGLYGINFHYSRYAPDGKSDLHETGSAGCQVFRYKKDHKAFMDLVEKHNRLFRPEHSYALFLEEDMENDNLPMAVSNPPPKEDDYPMYVLLGETGQAEDEVEESEPVAENENGESHSNVSITGWAKWILEKEARTKNGKIVVYDLPPGDGGGSYEVAGINEKYHPKEAAYFRKLIEDGTNDEVVRELIMKYLIQQTSIVEGWHPDERVIYFLRDCAFNRGATGAAEMYQMALRDAGLYKGSIDGKVGSQTKSAGKKLRAEDLILRLLTARVTRERQKRDETSEFWVGLNNRFIDCAQLALGIGDPFRFGS